MNRSLKISVAHASLAQKGVLCVEFAIVISSPDVSTDYQYGGISEYK